MAKKVRKASPVDPTKNVIALVKAGQKHQRQMDRQRDYYTGLLRKSEAKRINAIRAVDVGAVASAAAAAERAAGVLATQLVTTRDALVTQVATTAQAQESKLTAALEPIQKDIRELRDTQSKGVGANAPNTVQDALNDIRMELAKSQVQDALGNRTEERKESRSLQSRGYGIYALILAVGAIVGVVAPHIKF